MSAITESQTKVHPLTALLNREGIWVIDVRETDEYRFEHIAGTRHIPLNTLEKTAVQIPRDAEIHLICQTGLRSARAAALLKSLGYQNVFNVEGGLTEWKSAGGPVIRHGGPIPMERQVRIGAGCLVLLGSLVPGLKFIAVFVGAGLVFAGISGWCGMAKLLAFFPWNKTPPPPSSHAS